MTIKEYLKLYDFVYMKKTQMFLLISQFLMFIGYTCTNNMQVFGIMLLNIGITTVAVQFIWVTFSSYVQSSEKMQKYGIRNLTIITGAVNIAAFGIYLALKLLKCYLLKNYEDLSTMLFIYCISNLCMFVYAALSCKKRLIGGIILAVYIIFCFAQVPLFLRNIILRFESMAPNGQPFVQKIPLFGFLPNPIVMIIITAVIVSVVSPLIFYGLSMSLRKVSFSQKILDRQQYNKL